MVRAQLLGGRCKFLFAIYVHCMAMKKDGLTTQIRAFDTQSLADAVSQLRGGAPVALPTETVYGLAANAGSGKAVAEIYRVKNRPSFNPLIVHIADLAAAERIGVFSGAARKLADHFWPGPLTMVVPLGEAGRKTISPAVTAGLDTIALRCPAHPVMRAVLEQSGLPLAAPSANRSGAISPTTAQHVADSLGENVSMILDGGPCGEGLESTIVSVADAGWRVLRPGPITAAQIGDILGMAQSAAPQQDAGKITAPGQLASHYAPTKPLRLAANSAAADEWYIGFGVADGDDNLSPTGDLAEAAAALYAALHRADVAAPPKIAIAPIPDAGIGAAINDRLKRAAA